MKKYVSFFLVLLMLVLIVVSFDRHNTQNQARNIPNSTKSETYENLTSIDVNGSNYSVAWYLAESDNNIRLINNLEQEFDASGAYKTYDCKLLTSAGYYTKEGNPAGLFVVDGNLIGKENVDSLLQNAFLYRYNNKLYIERRKPSHDTDFILQSGPLLKYEGKYVDTIENDIKARRIALAQANNENVYIIAVYSPGSLFSGPKIQEMNKVLGEVENTLSEEFVSAINLDGGTASAYITEGYKLTEASMVGSFLCIK